MSTHHTSRRDDEPQGLSVNDVLDVQDAIRRLGSERLLRRVASLFLTNSPRLMDELRQAIAEGDARRLERSAHTLVSSMAYFSARSATDAALRLEVIGREGQMGNAGDALATLELEVEKLRAVLPQLLSEDSA